jgi:hypothetical protein
MLESDKEVKVEEWSIGEWVVVRVMNEWKMNG